VIIKKLPFSDWSLKKKMFIDREPFYFRVNKTFYSPSQFVIFIFLTHAFLLLFFFLYHGDKRENRGINIDKNDTEQLSKEIHKKKVIT